jgi:RNA recognition motif-containing protein
MSSKEEKTDMEEEKPAAVADSAADQSAPTEEDAGEAAKKHDEGGDEIVDSAADAKPPSEEDRSKRVYIGNLAWEVSWQDLKDHMKSTGLEVTRANVMTTPDGRSKGCGIAEFATVDDATKAVADLNETELFGRQIFVREDREEKSGATSLARPATAAGTGGHRFSTGEEAKNKRVYVGNLSWDVAWQDLKDHMRQAGEVVHAEVITEFTGRSKGCGIVEYSSEAEAQEAISTLTDTELKGRMIFVREDRETNQGGHPSGGGGGRSQNTSVYVWNLAPEVSWQDLKDHMRKAGNVDSATILTNSHGESVGCGVVVYQRPQEAARAIRELQNSELKGRPMFAREDREAGRGGPGRGRGRGRGGRSGRGGFQGRGRGGVLWSIVVTHNN